jgi:DNA-binding beta-propeller fold protein YncE
MIAIVEERAGRVGFYNPGPGLPLAFVSVGSLPHEIAISDDGATAYVSNFGVRDYEENIGQPGYNVSVIDIPNACEIDRGQRDGSKGRAT